MTLLADYRSARRNEDVARLRRAVALRALVATASSQREIAQALGISQPAVSQQLSAARLLNRIYAETLAEAAAPVLVRLAGDLGFTRLAVFGSMARREARPDSNIDLLVDAPADTTIVDLETLRQTSPQMLGRPVDLVTYGGLDSQRDSDFLGEARELSRRPKPTVREP